MWNILQEKKEIEMKHKLYLILVEPFELRLRLIFQ